jgi:hypothetical protein
VPFVQTSALPNEPEVNFGSSNSLLLKILELMLIASFAGKLRLSQLATAKNPGADDRD